MAGDGTGRSFDHVVAVLFENRSFDSVLGRLYEPGEVASFEGVLGKDLSNPIPSLRYTEGRLLLLDAATGRIRATRRVTGWPAGWGFVQEGRRIAIQSTSDVTSLGPTALELWDATTLESIGERVTVAGNGTPGDASPDGTKLVTGTDGGDVVLWDLDPERWEKLACRIAGRNLTRAEWNQYLPGRDYHRTCPA